MDPYKTRSLAQHSTVIALLLVSWWLASRFSGGLLPGPLESLEWMASREPPGRIIWNVAITVKNSVAGFTLAFTAAVATLLFSRVNLYTRLLVETFNVYVQSISALVWILVFLVIFGFKSPLPPILVTAGVSYPILLSSLLEGMETVDSKIVELSRLLGATRLQLFRHIYLPASIPFAVAGSRAALGAALRISVVAEAFGSAGGIGYMLNYYFETYNYAGMMGWALLLVVLMVALDRAILAPVESRSKRWLP